MNLLSQALLFVAALFVILLLSDRIMQRAGHLPGRWFDVLQLATGASGIILHALLIAGPGWTIRFFAVTLLLPTLVELVGMRRGFPFGRYTYTSGSGPRLPGGVPAAVKAMASRAQSRVSSSPRPRRLPPAPERSGEAKNQSPSAAMSDA